MCTARVDSTRKCNDMRATNSDLFSLSEHTRWNQTFHIIGTNCIHLLFHHLSRLCFHTSHHYAPSTSLTHFPSQPTQACWILQNFDEIKFKSEQNIVAAMNCIQNALLNDHELPVKVEAAMALSAFLASQNRAEKIVEPNVSVCRRTERKRKCECSNFFHHLPSALYQCVFMYNIT